MKTVTDFKIIDGIATLEGVAFSEEASVVDYFLKNNNRIQKASVISIDGRSFELREGKLVLSIDKTFFNPYYTNEIITNNLNDEKKDMNLIDYKNENYVTVEKIEKQLLIQEKRIDKLFTIIEGISVLLNSYLK